MQYKKVIALAVVILVLVGGSVAWWLTNHGKVTLEEISVRGASVILQYDLTDPKLVNVLWQQIQGNNATINIYRSRDSKTWELWKQVQVKEANGRLTLQTADGELARDYQYYVEVVGDDGTKTVVLPPSPLVPPTPDPTQPGATTTTSTSPGGSPSTPPGTTPPATSTAPTQPAATSTPPTSTSTATTTSAPPPSTGLPYTSYYSPNGQLSGTSSIPLITDPFWARHFGNTIEIGWQNLPADTASVWILRSASVGGPWEQLLHHDNVAGIPSGSLRFIDSSIHEDHYYLLEGVTLGNATTTLGPILLRAI